MKGISCKEFFCHSKMLLYDWHPLLLEILDPPSGRKPIIFTISPKNCVKMKTFEPGGEGARPWRPLDTPMIYMLRRKNNSHLHGKRQ